MTRVLSSTWSHVGAAIYEPFLALGERSETVYSTYVLTDVVVSSFAVVGDARPLERLGLSAARVESTTPVPGGEPIRSCWDRKLNASC